MTAQIANRIRLYGAWQTMLSSPEVALWNTLGFRPPFVSNSTANRTGYVSHWAVRDGQLFLTDITGSVCRHEAMPGVDPSWRCQTGHIGECDLAEFHLSDILTVMPGGVFAEWFTGELRIPNGGLVKYRHADWESEFERDLYLAVECGLVVLERIGLPSAPTSSYTEWGLLRWLLNRFTDPRSGKKNLKTDNGAGSCSLKPRYTAPVHLVGRQKGTSFENDDGQRQVIFLQSQTAAFA